jgi:hypothetical protein
MPKVKLSVTKKDIAQGVPSDPNSCPIALAANRIGLNEADVDAVEISFPYSVGTKDSWGWDDEETYHVKLPKAAQKFVSDFDECEGSDDIDTKTKKTTVKPFSFTVNIPKKVLKGLKLKKKAFVATV